MGPRHHLPELSDAEFTDIRQTPIVTRLWPCLLMGSASWLLLFSLYQWLS